MTQTLLPLQKVAEKATWLESAMSQWPLVAPQVPDEFTSADVHYLIPEPANHNLYGALFKRLQSAGLIRFDRYEKSTRPERRGGVTGVWRKI